MFQKSWAEIQIENGRKFNVEAKIYTYSGPATVKRQCGNIYREYNTEATVTHPNCKSHHHNLNF